MAGEDSKAASNLLEGQLLKLGTWSMLARDSLGRGRNRK
jgi:hypothetical protein